MSGIAMVGPDLARNVCQAHGADGCGRTILRRRLQRHRALSFFAPLPPCIVAMEA